MKYFIPVWVSSGISVLWISSVRNRFVSELCEQRYRACSTCGRDENCVQNFD